MKELKCSLESSQFKKRVPHAPPSAGDAGDKPHQRTACCPDPLLLHRLTPCPPLACQPCTVCLTAAC